MKALKPVRDRFPDRLIVQSIFGPKKNIKSFEDEGYLVIAEPCRALEVVAALVKIGQGFTRGLPQVDDLSAPTLEPGVYNEVESKRVLAEAGIPAGQERRPQGGVATFRKERTISRL